MTTWHLPNQTTKLALASCVNVTLNCRMWLVLTCVNVTLNCGFDIGCSNCVLKLQLQWYHLDYELRLMTTFINIHKSYFMFMTVVMSWI